MISKFCGRKIRKIFILLLISSPSLKKQIVKFETKKKETSFYAPCNLISSSRISTCPEEKKRTRNVTLLISRRILLPKFHPWKTPPHYYSSDASTLASWSVAKFRGCGITRYTPHSLRILPRHPKRERCAPEKYCWKKRREDTCLSNFISPIFSSLLPLAREFSRGKRNCE